MTITELQSRAAGDPELRAALLTDPVGTLAEHGITVPDGVTVRMIDARAGELVVPLPPVETGDGVGSGALADAQLAGVSAGWSWLFPGAPGGGGTAWNGGTVWMGAGLGGRAT